jgi:hypothetical protein
MKVQDVLGEFTSSIRWVKVLKISFLVVVPCCILGVAYSRANDDDESNSQAQVGARRTSDAAIWEFWDAYHGNRFDQIPGVQKSLEQAIHLDSQNPTLYALLGATHFWHFGEASRDPNLDLNVLRQDMPTAVGLFQQALNLDYNSRHLIGYVNDDHLPGYLGITMVHAGRLSNDPSLVAKGDQTLDYAVYQFPEFNNFNRWAAHNADSKDSDTYRKSLDSLWQALDACAGATVDRANPDLAPYMHLQTAVGRKKACWSQGDLAPHSFEGFMLNLGNGLVKAGQVEAAKVMYGNARYADNYATWPYRTVLESIAASDLYVRAALYADGDSSNDPPLGVPNRGCVYCHATAPETSVPQGTGLVH